MCCDMYLFCNDIYFSAGAKKPGRGRGRPPKIVSSDDAPASRPPSPAEKPDQSRAKGTSPDPKQEVSGGDGK